MSPFPATCPHGPLLVLTVYPILALFLVAQKARIPGVGVPPGDVGEEMGGGASGLSR